MPQVQIVRFSDYLTIQRLIKQLRTKYNRIGDQYLLSLQYFLNQCQIYTSKISYQRYCGVKKSRQQIIWALSISLVDCYNQKLQITGRTNQPVESSVSRCKETTASAKMCDLQAKRAPLFLQLGSQNVSGGNIALTFPRVVKQYCLPHYLTITLSQGYCDYLDYCSQGCRRVENISPQTGQ